MIGFHEVLRLSADYTEAVLATPAGERTVTLLRMVKESRPPRPGDYLEITGDGGQYVRPRG